jgi:hypothetical protein
MIAAIRRFTGKLAWVEQTLALAISFLSLSRVAGKFESEARASLAPGIG